MVQLTNAYATWILAKQQTRPDNSWYEVTEPEMSAFLTIKILMGILDLPQIEMYWSTDPFLKIVDFLKTMTCNRFQKIMKYFHFSDRAQEPARDHADFDPLYKVRPIMDRLLETFQAAYILCREVSVDEGMMAFAGRLFYRQYMPVKRGVKVWMLADANSAYLGKFEFYLGRQEARTEHGLGYNAVMKVSDHLRHTHRHMYFDNFFTSVPLLEDLSQHGLYACGTVRPMRKGFPKKLQKPADVRNREQYRLLQKGDSNLTATVWMDKRLVHHLSTLSDPQLRLQTQRRNGRDVEMLPIPHTVHEYSRFMGGVDLHDQHRACYSVGRNGKKAWRYMFWFMFMPPSSMPSSYTREYPAG